MAQDNTTDCKEKESTSFLSRAGWFLVGAVLAGLGALLLIACGWNILVAITAAVLLMGAATTLYEAIRPDNTPENSILSANSAPAQDRVPAQLPVKQPGNQQVAAEDDPEKRLDPSWGPPSLALPLKPVEMPEPDPPPQQIQETQENASSDQENNASLPQPATTVNNASASRPLTTVNASRSA